MAYTVKIQTTATISSGGSITGSDVETGNTLTQQTFTFPAASSGAAMTMTLTRANLQMVMMVASQNCTVKTNSNSSPQDTFNMVAGIPSPLWGVSGGAANPFAGNVTGAFVTCTPATTIQYVILQT